MDDADLADKNSEMILLAALAARKPVLYYNGHCYNCGETSAGVFCDADCMSDWERQKAAERRAGM